MIKLCVIKLTNSSLIQARPGLSVVLVVSLSTGMAGVTGGRSRGVGVGLMGRPAGEVSVFPGAVCGTAWVLWRRTSVLLPRWLLRRLLGGGEPLLLIQGENKELMADTNVLTCECSRCIWNY